MMKTNLPTVVLICHEGDRLDTEGLASWLASTMNLAGLIVISDKGRRLWTAARRELRRVGLARLSRRRRLPRVRAAAPARQRRRVEGASSRRAARRSIPRTSTACRESLSRIRTATASREFLNSVKPDIVIARCKFILKPEIFSLARVGAFALHPGICPEYRNAHGCFWALVNRDLDRVGMTLLKIDKGIDTGPVYLQAGCSIDELAESHIVIQYRVVIENLDAHRGDADRSVQRKTRGADSHGRPQVGRVGPATAHRLPAVEESRAERKDECNPYRCCFMTST